MYLQQIRNATIFYIMAEKILIDPSEHPLVHSDRGCHYRWVE